MNRRNEIRSTIHPGRILKRELKAREVSANALALALRTPSGRITDILNEKRAVTTDTAMRLGCYFGQSPRFWINLQSNYDLQTAEAEFGDKLDIEVAKAG